MALDLLDAELAETLSSEGPSLFLRYVRESGATYVRNVASLSFGPEFGLLRWKACVNGERLN